MVSYIPPNSCFSIYDEHINNVLNIAADYDTSELAVFGDFNLGKVIWTHFPDSSYMCATNVNSDIEINLIDSFLAIDLGQINCFFNALNRVLDLIFISENLKFKICSCDHPLSLTDEHHVALEVEFEFFQFPQLKSIGQSYFDFKNCNFNLLNTSILSIDWSSYFSDLTVTDCYCKFVKTISDLTSKYIHYKGGKIHKLPWYTSGLKKLKNLRNKFYKSYKSTNDSESKRLYNYYSREFSFLNKFLYKQYILSFQERINSNPKSFWDFVQSKKSSSNFPSAMHLGNVSANTTSEIVNLFADFFKSNFDNDGPFEDSKFLDLVESCIDFGLIQLDIKDISFGIADLKSYQKLDMDGFSASLLKKYLLPYASHY